jgi:hypothetical protein
MVAQLDITNNSQEEFYVTPQLRFNDTSGTVFVITDGLWADRPLPDVKNAMKKPMYFLAGTRHKLDLALQFEGETDWYGIDTGSPFKNFRYEKHKLTGVINLTVTLVGNMPSITRYFQLKEENGTAKFDEIISVLQKP